MTASAVLAETFADPAEWDVPADAKLIESPSERFRLPRVRRLPRECRRNQRLGLEVVDLAGEAGLELDFWQEWVLQQMLLLRPGGLWAALRFGLVVGRQNGKGSIIEARELAALFLDRDRWPQVAAPLTVHTAHESATAGNGFRRLWGLIEGTPRLAARVAGAPNMADGKQRIKMVDGREIIFRTRTKGGGRGLSPDLLIFDEAMRLEETVHDALFYAASARPNPQALYFGSAPDASKWDPALGVVLARLRADALKGDDPDVGYLEYSLDYERPEDVPESVAADPESWAATNPALDIRISRRWLASERRSGPRGFARERLSVGDWPAVDAADSVIPQAAWKLCADPAAEPDRSRPVFAFDLSPARTRWAVAVAGRRGDGRIVVGMLECGSSGADGLRAFVERLAERYGRSATFLYEGSSPAASLAPRLEAGRVRVRAVGAAEYAAACGSFFDAATACVASDRLVHRDEPALNDAVRGASKRNVDDRFRWTRRKSEADITPLVCATIAYDYVASRASGASGVVDLSRLMEDEEGDVSFDESGLPPL